MEYLLSFLLLSINLIAFQFGINRIVFLIAGTILFALLFFRCFYKTKSFLGCALMMFCHTWQISWMNILGEPTANLQLPWFYIIGVLCIGYTLFNFSKVFDKQVNAPFMILFICTIVISVFPLFSSPSIAEGLKEFIMIMFFLLMLFVGFLFCDTVNEKTREHVFNSYTWCVFISSAFLILQYFIYHTFGIPLFNFEIGEYAGNTMASAALLMGDPSSATIMLGSAVFICISRIEKKKSIPYNVICILTIVIGMALTSRRTSIVALIIVLALYSFFHFKGPAKKILTLMLFAVLGVIMLYYLLISRPVDDLAMYLYDNHRFTNYIRTLEVSLIHPFGIGYDNVHAVTFMTDNIVPHFTVLRWLLMGGYWFAIPMTALVVLTWYTARKKNLSTESWIILYSFFASCFIPDILNARFFVIPCMCAMLAAKINKPSKAMLKRI